MEKYIAARAIGRTAVTKLINRIETMIISADLKIEDIDDCFDLLTEKEKDLIKLNAKIFDLTNTENLEKELKSVEEYKESILLCKNKLTRAKTKLSSTHLESNITPPVNINNEMKASNIKLPRLTIEQFDGDIIKWPEFWARFKISIHENDSLSNVEKLSYLKSYMTKDGERAISGLLTTNENYESAIKILHERFGRKDLIIDRHMSALLHMAPCRNSRDVVSLRNIYDTCDLQINSLRSLGIEPDSYGTLLFPILIKALPNDIILMFTRSYTSDKNKISDLLTFLKAEVESRERASLLAETQNENNRIKNFVKPQEDRSYKFVRSYDNKNKKQSTAILNATTEKFCIFCDKLGNHVSDNCKCHNLNQKKILLKQKGRCFSCYKKYHLQRNCRINVECTNCHSKEHRKGLCDKIDSIESNSSQISVVDSNTVVTSVIPVLKNETNNKTILMSTFKAVIVTPDKKLKVRCLLDSGSERTFIHKQVCNKLNLPIVGKETINLNTFGSTDSVKFVRSKFQFKLCNTDDANKFVMIDALESPEICGAFIEAPCKEFINYIQSLNIKLSDCDEHPQNIDVLIGSDYFWKIVTGKTKRLNSSLMLIETNMGWSVQGPVPQTPLINESSTVNVLNAVISKGLEDDNLTSSYIKSFWELESIGIKEETSKRTISNNEAYQNLRSNLTFKDNRYEVKLPWKHDSIDLKDNYFNAEKRLRSLISRCIRDPHLYTDYNEVIEEYLRLGIAETVVDENNKPVIPVYYLPHHPVIRKDKDTTKLRIVFDASSHSPKSPSLNDLLHPGPNLNPDLLNLLLKFRLNKIAFIADIEKAFLMISLNENDRDVVRFLWVNSLPENSSKIQPIILRMKRVLFGVTSSPFLLAGVIKFHLEKYCHKYPETCSILSDAMYVDDLLSGSSNEEEAFMISKEAKLIMDEAGMKLRKWKSNSKELEQLWRNSEVEFNPKEIQIQDETVLIKVLGLIWDRYKDIFKFDVSNLVQFIKNSDKTKRTLIRSAGRIFDPIGFLSPFTMRLKILFQELWEKGVHWDEELPKDVARQWDIWCEELPLINNLEIPRHYFDSISIEDLKYIQIHCFTDSSEIAYGAVIYLRFTDINDDTSVRFLLSKGRLAPLKKLTIPRLELTAALIGARLISHIKPVFQNLHIDVSYHCWTDSSIALAWIKESSSKWKPYVANRVQEIQSLTDPETWHHCPGQTNPADIITRKKKLSELIASDLWWSGPEWLQKEENWPKTLHSIPDSESVLYSEARKLQVSLLTAVGESLFDLKMFGTLNKTIRVTAWIKRFVENLKRKVKNTEPLNSSEIFEAENFWIIHVQKLTFSSERDMLIQDKELKNDSKIKCFDPFLDENCIIRIGGRLQFANITEDEKHPILLPYDSELSALIVKSCHEKVAHCGLTATLAELRSNYYIIKARKLTKKILNDCLICKRYRAKAFLEKTAPLPADRMKMCAAFDVTGIDFAGPLFIKENGSSKKAYICLFTCASVRAIHLELVSDLRTQTFILAFKRFVGRRGLCRTVYSDNAATFKKADKELQRWLNKKSELQEYFGSQRIEWKYIVPLAAWWGGFWERMVRSVKSCLKKILGKALLTYEELTTVLVEIEAILNSRPLTYTYDDVLEPSPLTPAHFLVGHRLTTLPAKNCDPEKTDLRNRLKYQQTLIEHFWKRWKQQYLLELRSNHMVSPSNGCNIKINDIVLSGGNKEPRQVWQLGKVIEVYPGRDGQIRACAIKTPRGVIRRPLQLLYNLEIS